MWEKGKLHQRESVSAGNSRRQTHTTRQGCTESLCLLVFSFYALFMLVSLIPIKQRQFLLDFSFTATQIQISHCQIFDISFTL